MWVFSAWKNFSVETIISGFQAANVISYNNTDLSDDDENYKLLSEDTLLKLFYSDSNESDGFYFI